MRAPSRLAAVLLVFVLVMSLSAAKSAVTPPPARAGIIPSPCDLIPDGAARTACKAVTDPVGTAVGAIPGIPSPTDVVGDVANAIVQPILNQVAQAEADAVLYVLKETTKFVDTSTTPVITANWFLRLYAIVFGMAIPLGIIMFYMKVVAGVRDQDLGGIGASFFSLMGLITLGGLLPGVVGLLVIEMDNKVAPGWMSTAGASASDSLNNLGVDFSKSISASNNPVIPILLPLLFLFFGLIGGLLIELMLLFREAMLYVVTATEIVAMAMVVSGRWGADSFWRTTRRLAVLCCFKPIVAFILTIGVLLLGSGGGAPPALMGSVVLLMVPILSWAAYRNWGDHPIQFLPGGWRHAKSAYNYVSSS